MTTQTETTMLQNYKNRMSPDESDVLEIDLERVKSEPLDVECESDSNPKDETRSDSIQEALAEHVIQRFNRSRYFRRNYASPESSVCEVCQAEFAGQDVLSLHKIAHFNTATVCYVCDTMFSDANGSTYGSTLTLHMASHHKTICIPTGNYKPEAERAFVCSICLQRFSSNKILSLHTSKQHNTKELKSITCKICSVDFMGNQALESHLLSRRHKEMKVKVQCLFMCVDCRCIFPARDSYAMHMMMRAQSESCTPLTDEYSDQHRPNPSPASIPLASPGFQINREVAKPRNTTPPPSEKLNGNASYQVSKGSPIFKEQKKFSTGDIFCTLCDLRFYHPDTLNVHMRMAHQNLKDLGLLQCWARQHLNATRISPSFLGSISFGGTAISWTCVACGQDFSYSSDSLAMHVMEKHSLSVVPTSNMDPSAIFSANTVLHNNNPLFRMSAINGAISKPHRCFNKSPNGIIGNYAEKSHVVTPSNRATEPNPNEKDEEGPVQRRRKLSGESEANVPKRQATPKEIFSKCSFCHEPFTDKDELVRHLKHCAPTTDDKKGVLQCNGCAKQFHSVANFSHHYCPNTDTPPGKFAAKCLMCAQFIEPQHTISHFDSDNKCRKEAKSQQIVNGSYDVKDTEKANETEVRKDDKEHVSDTEEIVEVEKQVPDNTECGTDKQSKTKDDDKQPEAPEKPTRKDDIIKNLVQDAIEMKRNRRKNRTVTRVLTNEETEPERSSKSPITAVELDLAETPGLIAIPVSPASSPTLKEAIPVLSASNDAAAHIDATGHESLQGQALFNYVMANSQHLIMCKYCEIIYTNRTMYYLHMGLHNLNNPWQCNLCGKVCSNVHEFSSHVIHYR